MVSHVSSSGLSSGQSVAFRGMSFLLWPVYPPPGLSSRSPAQILLMLCPRPLYLFPNTCVPQESGSVSPRCHVVWTHLRPQLLLSVPLYPGVRLLAGAWDRVYDQQLGNSSYYSCKTVCPGGVIVTGVHADSRGASCIRGGGLPGRVTGLLRSLIHLVFWGWLSYRLLNRGGGVTREFRHHSPGLGTRALRAQSLSAPTLCHAPCKPLCDIRVK